MKMINLKKYKLTISICIVLLLSVFTACSSNSVNVPDTVESPGDVEETKLEITSISILSALEPILFGKFPQTIDEEAQVTINKNSNGYYAGSNMQYYAQVNGKYYKVEDVLWDAFQLESGDILLVSRNILFSARYDNYHDYFEGERQILQNDGFVFTDEEEARIKSTNVKYEHRIQSSIYYCVQRFLLNFDQLNELYPTTNKVLKKPTDYAAIKLDVNEYGYSSWWLAPNKGKSLYVSDAGVISNKGNTYIDVTESFAYIRYAQRGMVPCMIISAN